ncbi:PGN_0703 family putative restriction endonuclease [Bradyrhizobium daqingense]|uniref:PGN_0703 family putative restriction endonuclease n=1 Tax=Bradyrhizobium daqingense TaxID=993502 RepID=UPI00384DA952
MPERLLQQFGGTCEIDSRFRRAARMLQILWMRDNDIPNAITDGEPSSHLASYLRADAAEEGRNFLNPDIHLLALRDLLLLREEDAAVDEDRLLMNSVSSMPATLNCIGPLALNLKLAGRVFKQLLPDFVHSVDRIIFEHSPGRRSANYLSDRSAFDAAVFVKMPDQGTGVIYLELKYTESLDHATKPWKPRQLEALREVGLYKDPDSPILHSGPCEQLSREHMTAQLAVRNGAVPRACFVGIGPSLNRRVQAAFRVYANELLPLDPADGSQVPFHHFTLETFIDAIDVAGDRDIADRLWERYCNFQRIYDAALNVLAPRLSPDVAASTSQAVPSEGRAGGERKRASQTERGGTGPVVPAPGASLDD